MIACTHCYGRSANDRCMNCGAYLPAIAALAAETQPSTPGQRMIRAAEEAVVIARGEAEPASVYPAPQPAPETESSMQKLHTAPEREALVEVILDAMLGRYPGRDMARAVADALLAAGWTRKREEG